MGDSNLLELLDMYIDMVEKQDEAIHQLSELVKKQAYEIAHMKNICGFSGDMNLIRARPVYYSSTKNRR